MSKTFGAALVSKVLCTAEETFTRGQKSEQSVKATHAGRFHVYVRLSFTNLIVVDELFHHSVSF